MLRFFEDLIDPFKAGPDTQPPQSLGAFFWHYTRQVWPGVAAIMVVGLFVGLIELSLFAFLGQIVDLARAASSPESFFAQHGETLAWMAFIALIVRPIVSAAHTIAIHQVLNPAMTTLIRWQSHRYVLRQSISFFNNDFAGRIATRVMQTGSSLREVVIQLVDAIWFVAIYTFGAVVLFFQADWRLMIPLGAWLLSYAFMIAYFVPRVQRLSTAASNARSALTGRVVDSYTNIQTVKLFAHSQGEERYARDAMEELRQRILAQMRVSTWMEITMISLNGVLIAGTTGLALWLWSIGSISLGAIALATGLVIRINNMAGWIMWTMTGIFENIGTVQEGTFTISQPVTVRDVPSAVELAVPHGEICYEGVGFHYGRITGGLIDGLNLTIRPGEKVGLVGRSGAGKSTLVGLLLRFHDLESGRILIDGQDIAEVTQDSLRAQIGLVTQDTSLLHRSVADNIRYGRPDASDAAVFAAARRAHAHDFILGLEDHEGRIGYAARVGERGVKLSGGQRQRVAIARVLLKNAPILVLDEATSALDSEVEAAIQEQLAGLMRGKTVIAIAHRLSTIAAMDRLIVMDGGQLVEEGAHDALIARGGIYAGLWRRQSGGFLVEEKVA